MATGKNKNAGVIFNSSVARNMIWGHLDILAQKSLKATTQLFLSLGGCKCPIAAFLATLLNSSNNQLLKSDKFMESKYHELEISSPTFAPKFTAHIL